MYDDYHMNVFVDWKLSIKLLLPLWDFDYIILLNVYFWVFISSQIAYPKREFVQSRFPSDGLKRHYRLSDQPKEVSTSTTQRPFFRVWNSFLRSVQPNFGFRNLTNPLANLFTNGATNIIETAPVQAEMYTDDQQADEVQQSSTAAAQSAKKRKRKRRKQQKRRPMYDSQEKEEHPYDYYGSTLHQPMYYYGPNDYYGMRRLQTFSDIAAQPNYYDQFYKDSSVEGDVPQYTTEENESFGKPSTKRFAIVRPVTLAIQLPNGDSSGASTLDVMPDDSVTNENVDESISSVGTDTEGNVDSESSAASNDDQMPLSESVRNAFGTYMRDDRESRKRQRQSEQKDMGEPAKWKPRKQLRYVLAARLVKNH
ncbi:uncharacterized protein LOC6575071 [Drosophila mojavensis]|uniref:Uncharacterized protein n=1 Tax=Drosophila mojavensis TaxID=7230 RepID=B4K8V5_DROMO|nr:uncharacterized protein LOC6575071 [Drosophila mojavensis]EDW16552.2 uncharacterized protein Dmoj_GI22162 [Drosophila mojavensis]